MPLYSFTSQVGTLDGAAKERLASQLTDLHAEYAGVPRNWVHIVFTDYPVGNGFTAGEPAPAIALTLLIRSGRSPDYKRELLKRLWQIVQAATGAEDNQIVLAIQEGPASQAMEMGITMPDVPES